MNRWYSFISVDTLIHPKMIFVCPNPDFLSWYYSYLLLWFMMFLVAGNFLTTTCLCYSDLHWLLLITWYLIYWFFLPPLILAAVVCDFFLSLLVFVPFLFYSPLLLDVGNFLLLVISCFHFLILFYRSYLKLAWKFSGYVQPLTFFDAAAKFSPTVYKWDRGLIVASYVDSNEKYFLAINP